MWPRVPIMGGGLRTEDCWAVLGTAHISSCLMTGLKAQKFQLKLAWKEGDYQIEENMAN